MRRGRWIVAIVLVYSVSLGASWLLHRPAAAPRFRCGPAPAREGGTRLRVSNYEDEEEGGDDLVPDPERIKQELRGLLPDLPAAPPGDDGDDVFQEGSDDDDRLPAHLPFATMRELEAFLEARPKGDDAEYRLNETLRASLAADEDDPFSVRLSAAEYLGASRWVTRDGLSRRAQEEAELDRLVAAATARADRGGGATDADDLPRWSSPDSDPPDAAEFLAGFNPIAWAAAAPPPPPATSTAADGNATAAAVEAVLDVPRLRALWEAAQARLAAAEVPGSAEAAERDAQDAELFASEPAHFNQSQVFRDSLTDPALAGVAWAERHGRDYRDRRDAVLRELEGEMVELERDLAEAERDPKVVRCSQCGCILGKVEIRENEGRRRKICQACHAEELEAASPRVDW